MKTEGNLLCLLWFLGCLKGRSRGWERQSDGGGCFLGLGKRKNVRPTGRLHCSMHMKGGQAGLSRGMSG